MGALPIQKILIPANGTPYSIDLTACVGSYYVYGGTTGSHITLTSSYTISEGVGTPYEGMRVRFEYNAFITLDSASVHIIFFTTTMPDDYVAKKVNVDCYYNGTAWVVDYTPDFFETDIITTNHIKAANVTLAKLEALTSGQVILGNSSNRPTGVAPTGDITITNAGVTAIGADKVTNAMIKAAAGIETSKLAASADIAKIANVTQAELEVLHDVTAGTSAASKAVVLSASSKINALDVTVLSLNGQTVAASGTELSELNSAGVVHLDFHQIAGLNAAGVTADDLALLAGAHAEGVTSDNIFGLKTDSPAKVQTKIQAVTTNATLATDAGVLIVDLTADTTITIPTTAGLQTSQYVQIIVRTNAAAAHDLVFTSADNIYYGDAAPANTKTIATIPVSTLLLLVNTAAGSWTLGGI